MPSPENKLLQEWFSPILKARGFTKTGATWHRSCGPFIHVFNIQGSQWSRSFYINLGIYLTSFGVPARPPSEAHCHLRERLDAILDDRERFLELCDFENGIPAAQRREELPVFVERGAVRWLDRMQSIEALRHFVVSEMKHGLPISAATYAYLGISPEQLDTRRLKLFQQAQRRAESIRSQA